MKRLGLLWRDTRAGVAPFLALSAFVLIGLGGIATDTARSYLVKSRLSTALDAAALAGGWGFFLDTRNADIQMFFDANFPPNYMGAQVIGPSIVIDEQAETVTLSATAKIPTLFMRLFGHDETMISAFSEVTRQMQALDMVLAIDMSGSMGNGLDGGSRISAARTSAKDLVDILFGVDTAKDLLNMGVVPWNGKVNVTYDGTTFDPEETEVLDVDGFTNPVSLLDQDVVYRANNSPVPLLWQPHETWEGCVYSRFIDDDDGDTNADTREPVYLDHLVEWPAWEPIGPSGEPASSNGSDIEVIQTSSASNFGDSLIATWDYAPKETNILVALASRSGGDQFSTPAGWESLQSFTADDGGVDRHMRVFARRAGPSEQSITINSDQDSHQAVTILEIANLDWWDLRDGVRLTDHTEHNRDYVSLKSYDNNNYGNIMIAMAAMATQEATGLAWSNSFSPVGAVEKSGDGGADDLTHAVAVRKVSSTSSFSTTLSTLSSPDVPTWGMIIALEDRHVCSATRNGGECTPCLSHGITPLTNQKQTVVDAINALQNPTGTTNITQGLGWAWRILTPDSPFDEAIADPDYNREQAVVLLTDGENYGGEGDGYKAVWGTGNGANNEMNDRLVALANRLKSAGVVLYVIQFANNGTALQSLLKSVASGSEEPYYHYAPDSAALQTVFREVANHLSQLRLSK